MTRISPASSLKPVSSSPLASSAARSSPAFTIGIPSIAVRLIVRIGGTSLLHLKRSQNHFGQRGGALGSGHDGVGCQRAHPEPLDRFEVAPIGVVEHEQSGYVAIEPRNSKRRGFHPKAAEHFVSGTLDRLAGHDRAYGRDARFDAAQSRTQAGRFQNRAKRDERIRRRQD